MRGLLIVFGLFVSNIIESLTSRHYYLNSNHLGMKLRIISSTCIYEKSLLLSNGARSKYTAGEITNLMSIDGNRLRQVASELNSLWSAPFQIIIGLSLLGIQVGWSCIGGLILMILMIPITGYVSRKVKFYRV